MPSRPANTRPLHALTAWLCIALQLCVFIASGWHSHTHHSFAADHARSLTVSAPPHSDSDNPADCSVCIAITALQHATPISPAASLAAPITALADPTAHPVARGLPSLWRQCARGPPANA